MTVTPDEILAEMLGIRARLDSLDAASPEYRDLEQHRRQLARAAQEAADAARSPARIRAELEHLELRLAAFEDEKIDVPAWQTAMPSINDPAAHPSVLNDKMDANNKLDRDALEERIERLQKALSR